MKSAALLAALLALSCSKSSSTPSNMGGAAQAGGGTAQAGADSTAQGGQAGSSESGAAGAVVVPPDDYDDSGCKHPTVTKDCSDGWCKVPPGCFIMGSPEHEWGHPPQEKRVKVTLTRGFVIGQHEVTNEQWASFKLANPGRVIDSGPGAGIGDCSEPECPVGNVTWFEAVSYANLLSEKEGLQSCYELTDCVNTIGAKPVGLVCQDFKIAAKTIYDCEGYRLPTDPEWEYAARAGTRTAFYSGEMSSRGESGVCVEEPALNGIAWYCFNAGKLTKRVGQLTPNGWGLFDMLGNAEEWSNDQSGWVPSTETLTDPDQTFGPGQGRDTRGGAPFAWPGICRAASRLSASASFASPGTGFRLVRTTRSEN
jgi:formylglycine-generating enzyme required for sulfatase activity